MNTNTETGDKAAFPAQQLLHGALWVETDAEGWAHPWRFMPEQLRQLSSVAAWHPGVFRQMASCTAGISIEFVTSAESFELEVAFDPVALDTRSTLSLARGLPEPADGISFECDGELKGVCVPTEGEQSIYFDVNAPAAGMAPAEDNEGEVPTYEQEMRLPGLGATHHVRLWLPCLRGCKLRALKCAGSIEPVASRKQLLVLGDSIAQGFIAADPALSWPVRLAESKGLDLVNQGLGSQVIQPGSLAGLQDEELPAAVVVAYGANYRYEPCAPELVASDMKRYFSELHQLFAEVPTWVATPTWHNEEAWPTDAKSCYKEVPALLGAAVAPYPEMQLIDGRRLMDATPELLADDIEHPCAAGMAQIAERLETQMAADVLDDGLTAARRRTLAARVVKAAGEEYFAFHETLRRRIGTTLYASEQLVAHRAGERELFLWIGDDVRAAEVLPTLARRYPDLGVVIVVGQQTADYVGELMGMSDQTPHYVLRYPHRRALERGAGRDIHPLTSDDLEAAWKLYDHHGYYMHDDFAARLEAGMLGAWYEGKLVGICGEHPEGSIGMLAIAPEMRRRGWGAALEAAKITEDLAQKHTPWVQIFPDNEASLKLQESLGMVEVPGEHIWLAREEDADED